jgi:hypothetical protein
VLEAFIRERTSVPELISDFATLRDIVDEAYFIAMKESYQEAIAA